jgi:hypothetical protein
LHKRVNLGRTNEPQLQVSYCRSFNSARLSAEPDADVISATLVCSVICVARSTPSTRRLGSCAGRSRSLSARGKRQADFWSIEFGVGGNNGDPNTLYFSYGIDGENHRLFGAIFANGSYIP